MGLVAPSRTWPGSAPDCAASPRLHLLRVRARASVCMCACACVCVYAYVRVRVPMSAFVHHTLSLSLSLSLSLKNKTKTCLLVVPLQIPLLSSVVRAWAFACGHARTGANERVHTCECVQSTCVNARTTCVRMCAHRASSLCARTRRAITGRMLCGVAFLVNASRRERSCTRAPARRVFLFSDGWSLPRP